MKKNSLAEFFKSKGYYVLLFVGIIAIAAVAILGSNLSSNKGNEGENHVDLNEPDNNIVAEDNNNLKADNNDASNQLANNELVDEPDVDGSSQDVADNDSLLEFDVYTEAEEDGIELAENEELVPVADVEGETKEEAPVVQTAGATVERIPSLSFDVDQGLLWPVEGNVIMNYSMDHLVYHATLMQFKVNPAIIIDAEVGTEVKAAAKGIITDIYDDPVTGLTVTTDIGDGFSLLYGQLADVNHKIGDVLSEGQLIGKINKPTKYYSIEGSNLYFMVTKDEQTENPMLYLR